MSFVAFILRYLKLLAIIIKGIIWKILSLFVSEV